MKKHFTETHLSSFLVFFRKHVFWKWKCPWQQPITSQKTLYNPNRKREGSFFLKNQHVRKSSQIHKKNTNITLWFIVDLIENVELVSYY